MMDRHRRPPVAAVWICCLAVWAAPARAQTRVAEAPSAVTLPHTEQRILRATSSGVGYKLYVALPSGYDSTRQRYPVVYLLDADYSFAIARNIVEHLSDRGHLRQAIVVGIAYAGPPAYQVNRTRDYTPTHILTGGYGPEAQAVSGGAPAFRRFIAEDLVPYIAHTYRASDERILVGHSYGGLFASWVALTQPSLFTGYIAVSPSLWYDSGMMFRLERSAIDGRDDLPIRMYMAVGSREINSERNMVTDLQRFASALEMQRWPHLALAWQVDENETHNSIFPRALSDGLRYVMQGR